ncbi:pyridoxal-phosphate dependent enzyme [Lacimicrobium sp. SS2-24]|uniref:1-aminocyclopropane-1-carboxylate deaminase/D-cysteine desulfhydrase n=1 Tax=Lacimicrobium sp. SS2-24 TaxID=2005569 RepID=UPI001FEEC912|nr:pyridoxal-phosphate dependent enzyme [Lacimicrobium sp. SS2-24]
MKQQYESLLEQKLGICTPSPVQPLHLDWPGSDRLHLFVKRDDLIHPIISGNKWRKLKYALSDAVHDGVNEVISFGGGHSNHLHALGYACMKLGIQLRAMVRGDYREHLTPTLTDLQNWGAQLHFLSKAEYQQRSDPAFLHKYHHQYPDALLIPEGGSQQQALAGVAEIYAELTQQVDVIMTPVGSGGTLAGLIHANAAVELVGVGVLKGEGYLEQLVTDLLPQPSHQRWQILHRFHCGGYAKATPDLLRCCEDVKQQCGFQVEPVYSGKLFFALAQLLKENYFSAGSRILILHTGGLRQ